jgi:SulP family sulfate permease
MVVGALIFVLGIDLVKEALWDTRHRVNRSEYLTIASIVVVMTVWDFVLGVLFGIVVSCFFFVIQNSQRRSIRSLHTGEMAVSAVRRPSAHRAYIREVSKQTMILRLQGFLFFGTITRVEETIRSIVEDSSWQRTPIRFLVVDLSLVAGVDMSSAEAFVRVQRMLAARNVVLVFCGFTTDSAVGMALQSVGVLGENSVELFVTFSDAMEWTENAYLRAWFRSQKAEVSAVVLPGRQDTDIDFPHSLASSPRRSQLHDVGYRTIGNDISSYLAAGESAEPYNTLIKAFSSYGDVNREKLRPLVPYLERRSVPEGMILWKQNEDPDGLYFIESGVLRASYKFADHTPSVDESMVPGTLAGELSALAGLPRNATVVVERQAVLWKLSISNLRRLEKDNPALATTFMQLVLKAAKIDYDVLLSALATRQ